MQPIARAGGKLRLTPITDESWNNIEVKYGRRLSTDVRQSILHATNQFLYSVDFERNAIPAKDATTLIASIKVEAEKFRAASNKLRELFSTSGGQTGFFAQHLIREHFHVPDHPTLGMYSPEPNGLTLEPHDRLFHVLGDALFPLRNVNPDGVLLSLISACDMALAADDDEKNNRPFREGTAWRNWICTLTVIAKENGLMWRVSKGSDKSDTTSPFVLLVEALQMYIPRGVRLHTHSHTRLSHRRFPAPADLNGTNKSRASKKVSRPKRRRASSVLGVLPLEPERKRRQIYVSTFDLQSAEWLRSVDDGC